MKIAIFQYAASMIIIFSGLLLIKTGVEKESIKSKMSKVNYTPVKNFGRPQYIIFGLFITIAGLALFFLKK